MSLKSVEEIIKTKEKYQTELDKTNEALRTYLVELKQMRHMFAETDEEKNGVDGVKENYMKKALRCKKLEDDNKRLRKLLKLVISCIELSYRMRRI